MKLIIKKGTTSNIVHIFIQDSSMSDGSGLTGLVYNSAGLAAYYIREGDASPTAITLADATIGTYTSGGFKEVDATNMPGIYELHPPNACLASGADQVVIFLKGATNMAPLPIEIQLRDNTEKDVKDVADAILVDTNELQTDWVNGGRLDAKLDLAIARIGVPAMESLAEDIAVIDYHTDDLESRLTAARAEYLDNLSAGAVALASVCTEARLAELAAANLPADVDAILADTNAIAGIGFPETKTLELATGEDEAEPLIIKDGYLYAVTCTNPGKVVKIALPDFRKVATLTFNAGESDPWGEICIVGDYLYVACDVSPGKVVKIDLTTFTEVDSLTLSVSSVTDVLADKDGIYLYVVSHDSPAVVVKIDVSTFTEVDKLTLGAGEDEAYGGCIYGSTLYVGCYISPGKIAKINLDSFTEEAVLTLSSGNDDIATLVAKAGYLYCGLDLSPGRVVKVNMSTFTEEATLVLNSGEDVIWSLSANDRYLFVVTNTSLMHVIVVDLDTFMRLFTWTAETGYNGNYSDSLLYGGFLFIGCETSPGRLIAVPFSTWQYTNEIQSKLPNDEIAGSADISRIVDDIKKHDNKITGLLM